MRWTRVVGLLALLTSTPLTARANGRFPAANQLVASSQRVLVRTTFGALVSDQGGPFGWICEKAFGIDGEQDPPVALLAQDRLAFASFQALWRSDPAGCSFTQAQGFGPGETLLDLAVERADPARAVAVTWQGSSRLTRVYGTTDGGAVWSLRGSLPELDGIPTTLDLAPSRPGRVVVAGAFSRDGALLGYASVSDDGGATWRRGEAPLQGEQSLFLSAVDPLDADRLYARTSGGAQDRLLVSGDAGESWSELTRVDGQMLAFALSPDGAQVAIGGPLAGLRVAARGSSTFASVRSAATSCAAWTTEGLHACGTGLGDDFAVGRSTDGGQTWTPLLARLADTLAPSSHCPSDSAVASTCEPLWPAQRATLDLIGKGSGGEAGAAGAGGSSGSGGVVGGGQGGGALAGRSGGSLSVAPPPGEGECGCRAVGAGGAGWPAGLLLAGLAARRRRARRSASGTSVRGR